MAVKQPRNVAYGISQALINTSPAPIVSKRAPKDSDKAEVGTIWVDQPNDDGYVLTSIVDNKAQWIGIGGGPGVFSEIGVNTAAGAPGTIISASSITALTGGITATAGDITAPAGNIITEGVLIGSQLILDAKAGTNVFVTSVGDLAYADIVFSPKGAGIVTQTRELIGGDVVLTNFNTDNTDAGSNSTIGAAVGGAGGGDARFQAVIDNGAMYTWGIDNSTPNDNFVISKGPALGTDNMLSFDGTFKNATFDASVTTNAWFTVGNNGPQIMSGTAVPDSTITAPKGSLYIKTDASTAATRIYINTDGNDSWTNLTAAA